MAGHTPKIGRNFIKQQVNDLSPEETAAREAAGVALDAPLTSEEVNAREAVKAALLQQVAAPVEPAPPVSVLGGALANTNGLARLIALDKDARAGQQAVTDEAVAKADALLAPHRDAGKDAIARFDKLKEKVAQRVRGVAMLNRAYEIDVHAGRPFSGKVAVAAILKRVKPVLVVGLDHAPNHFWIVQFVKTACEIDEMFRFTLHDPQDKDGLLFHLNAAHAWVQGSPGSSECRNAINHAKWYAAREVASVQGVEDLYAKFCAMEKKVAADLDAAALVDVAPEAPREVLPVIPPTPAWLNPQAKTTGMESWDPRSIMREPAPEDDGVKVVPLGDGAGYRVEGS